MRGFPFQMISFEQLYLCCIPARSRPSHVTWVARIGQRYLSNAAFFILRMLHLVKDRHGLLHDSPLLKKTSLRQVALDKWSPLHHTHRQARVRRRKAQGSSSPSDSPRPPTIIL